MICMALGVETGFSTALLHQIQYIAGSMLERHVHEQLPAIVYSNEESSKTLWLTFSSASLTDPVSPNLCSLTSHLRNKRVMS